MKMIVIVTGAAGFIGFHLSRALLDRGDQVIGLDDLNDYYSVSLKNARLEQLRLYPNFHFARVNVSDREAVFEVFDRHADAAVVVHLAAQAGVRHSLVDPYIYVQSNVMGQIVILEASRRLNHPQHIVYASSSSVYGGNTRLPFSVDDAVDRPISLYAATKRSAELIGYNYSHLYGLPTTGLRFFTVYGPWGRPDMAAYLFTEAIFAGRPITVFNHGDMERDFTFIDDIVGGILSAIARPPPADGGLGVRHRVYNLGNHRSEKLMDFIGLIEASIGRKAVIDFEPIQPGDVKATWADIEASRRDLGFEPATPIETGVPRFVTWYKAYHGAD